MRIIEDFLGRINPSPTWSKDVPLAPYTSFRIGGPADYLVEPSDEEQVATLVDFCRREGLPYFVLGGGANVLISDRGIRGLTLLTRRLRAFEIRDGKVRLGCGWDVDAAAARCQALGFRCLDFAAGMPGSVGGAVWMNARCYEREVADILVSARVLGPGGPYTYRFDSADWAYKRSPFQGRPDVILEAVFSLQEDDPQRIATDMQGLRADRERKGHYRAPSAGSVFKNNRAFGQPSGALIDRLGLKGLRVGGAQVSEWHANIIVNTGSATAREVRDLVELVKQRVLEATGFLLEEEVLYVGDWS